ncbi:acetyltransferase [Intrasporangium oryzae NRRL B-24470]|uniref:Acetyltransferase n=1 Tax=Intrasporangium oryzae NRRL B-24470 TaxID=1386089 RepID=W9GEC4_9MICO|nr:GNAT family N-acetyltransferase [Intrasporangium oryzae]EWT03562.1 acetyltransferase [Intrasporangium oryzae NRRL B-24470]
MSHDLRIEAVDDATLADWQHVHNVIIPTAPLSLDEVRERVTRNRLVVAYAGDVLVGNATVRPPADDTATATVIVRVLPEHRGRGLGTALLERELAAAREMGARELETVVLASNTDGLRFARAHGFVDEIDRYLPEGDVHPFITLRLV